MQQLHNNQQSLTASTTKHYPSVTPFPCYHYSLYTGALQTLSHPHCTSTLEHTQGTEGKEA